MVVPQENGKNVYLPFENLSDLSAAISKLVSEGQIPAPEPVRSTNPISSTDFSFYTKNYEKDKDDKKQQKTTAATLITENTTTEKPKKLIKHGGFLQEIDSSEQILKEESKNQEQKNIDFNKDFAIVQQER